MGFALPNGAHVYLASGYGPAITFTGATNAENMVITVSEADTLKVDDIVHVNCNWSGVDNVIAKIDAIAESAVTLRNINTTNKNKYAAGGDTGISIAAPAGRRRRDRSGLHVRAEGEGEPVLGGHGIF